jgi:ferric enterobactin receptor
MDMGFWNFNEQLITTSGHNFYISTNYIQEKDILMFNQISKKTKLPSSEFGQKEF